MNEPDIEFAVEDGIGAVLLNRPQARNALTLGMYERLREIFSSAERDGLKAIVLSGAGGRAFASGTDIATFRDMQTHADAIAYEARIDTVLEAIERCPVPSIAVLSGACTGGGAAIAACCDIRIATADLKFGFPIARTLGKCLSVASISRLAALTGAGRVRAMLLTAALIGADDCQTAGLITEILPDHDAALARGHAMARELAANAPLTIRATKEAMSRLRVDGPRADDHDLIVQCYMSQDFRNAVASFIARKPPAWTGS